MPLIDIRDTENQFQRKDTKFSFDGLTWCVLWVAWGDVSSDGSNYRQELGWRNSQREGVCIRAGVKAMRTDETQGECQEG